MSTTKYFLGYASKIDKEKEKEKEKKKEKLEKAIELNAWVEKGLKNKKEEKKEQDELLQHYTSIYQDIKIKFPDIDINFYMECRNPYYIDKDFIKKHLINAGVFESLYNIDLKSLNYNKYIAYKLSKYVQLVSNINKTSILKQYRDQLYLNRPDLKILRLTAIAKEISDLKDFINRLDAKIFMDNVNIKWDMLQYTIKNNLKPHNSKPSPNISAKSSSSSKPSPKASPKTSPNISAKSSSSPKASPKPSPKPSPKTSPKASLNISDKSSSSPKTSPKTSPKPSPKTSPNISAKSSSPKASPKPSPKASPKPSPKASPKKSLNRDEIVGLSMEDLFAKLDTR